MSNKLRFKSCYTVTIIEPDKVFILSERENICLSDRFSYLVASLIDGERSKDEIIEAIQIQLLPAECTQDKAALFQQVLDISIKAQAALFQMEKAGYIVEQDDILPENLITFCHHLKVDPDQASQHLKETRIAVKAVAGLGKEDLIASLKSLDIQVINESDLDKPDLNVVLTDDYLNPDLDQFNQKSLEFQVPWLLIKPIGTMIWLGPLFDSQQTACWQCLASRLRENRPIEGFIRRKNNQSVVAPQELISSTWQTVLGMVATEVLKWIVQGTNNHLTNKLITYDSLTLQSQEHPVVKRPQCKSCGYIGQGLKQQPLPVVLGHRQKTFTADGGHRFCPPEETLRKYQHHLSPLTGVVRELTKLPGNKLNHTYIAKHHFVTIFDDLDNLRKNLSGRSSGKGKTDLQARASGFCEAIERYSGVFQGYEPRTLANYQQMESKAIHPNDCMNFSYQQYQTRTEWNSQCQGWFQKVPEPFDEERAIDWTALWSLTAQDFKYLPSAYCYYGYPQASHIDCWADSNGCAAGNTIEEAILQGFMELVERDSVALWWYNRLSKPEVDLASFNDSYFASMQEYYRQLGRDLWVLDITSDLNIPSFAAISSKRDCAVEDIILGYGTHFDAKIALGRALTEVNQILPSVISTKPDGTTNYPQHTDPLAIKWWQKATLAEHSYLVPDPKITPQVFTDYPYVASDDLSDDVKRCQKIVEEKNMEMLVLDQTRPDIGLRVAKVVVPGMRHMWKRLGKGRLYDVPVKMGWLQESLTEEKLNPFPMWM